MTHIVKLNGGAPEKAVADLFRDHSDRLYRWENVVAIVEFTGDERTEPRPDLNDKLGTVHIKIAQIEIASRAQERHLRTAMDALHRLRTGKGNLDELLAGDHERTLELTGAVLLDDRQGEP